MSYILQGSGAVLGPCLSHIVTREVSRLAPCICLKCSRLVSPVPDRGKSPWRHLSTISSQDAGAALPSIASSPPVSMIRDLSPDTMSHSYRSRYTSPRFRETYYTSYTVPMSGSQLGQLNVNLTMSVAPDHVTGLSYR